MLRNSAKGIIQKIRRNLHHFRTEMVRPSGLEPPTPTMSRWCSNQLSYGRRMVRSIGLEPTTPTMSRWCSNQLSYERNVLSATTGTNISGTPRIRQEGKRNFLSDFTRLLYSRSKCRESSRPPAATVHLTRGALQNHRRWLTLQEAHSQHHQNSRRG